MPIMLMNINSRTYFGKSERIAARARAMTPRRLAEAYLATNPSSAWRSLISLTAPIASSELRLVAKAHSVDC